MNNILLINRPNPEDDSKIKHSIFFVIGGMEMPHIENKLIDVLSNYDKINVDDILYRYNGVELNITTQEIPEIVKLFVENDLLVYSIYEKYDPTI